MVAPSHLKSLQALEMAVRTGSFTLAAEGLGITPAAVGQRVKALEDYLGIALLIRGRSGIKPAPELAAALPHLAQAFAELEAAAREFDIQRAHELHIAAPSDFVELWLAPRLEAFRAEHPNIRFCINGEGDAPIRLGAVDCRIAFEEGGAGPEVDRLFGDLVLPLSSPANADRIGAREMRARLEGFPLLHLDFYKDDPARITWPDWITTNGFERTAPERGIRFQRIVPALDAVLASAGLTLCGLALIADRYESGAIALPFSLATALQTRHAFHARYRADSATRRHVARFRAWLCQESTATAHWIDELALNGMAEREFPRE
jgi:LysR family transcriptional regulator, glycine cleavage system transcriptional activator